MKMITGAQIKELIKGKTIEQLDDEMWETVHTLATLLERIDDILNDKKELLVLGGIAFVGCIVSAGSPDATITIGLPEPVNLALNTLQEVSGRNQQKVNKNLTL